MHARFPLVCFVGLPLLSISCGGTTSKSSQVDAHTIHTSDSGSTDGHGSGSATCQAAASYGTAMQLDPGAESTGSGSAEDIDYEANLNANTNPDVLDIHLYAGYGAFASTAGSDIVPGTYTISSANGEDDFTMCGACIQVFASFNGSAGSGVDPVGSYYMASSGSLTITTVQPTLAGSISNVALRHVDYTMDGSGDITAQATDADDCMTTITSATFSTAVTAGSGG